MSLPSIAIRKNDTGGERSCVIKKKDTAVFAREVDGMIYFTRIEKGEVNKIDLENMIDKTEKVVLKEKNVKMTKCMLVTRTCELIFVANNNIVNEHDGVVLVRFKAFKADTYLIPYGQYIVVY